MAGQRTKLVVSSKSALPVPVNQRSSPAMFALLLAVVSLAVVITLWPALDNKVISFDDDEYLVNNKLVQNPSWHSAGRFLGEVLHPSTVRGYYQPLAMISLMLDCARGGSPANLRPFHETGLALHVVNTSLAIVLLHLLFGNVYVAAAVGLVYGVHPLAVEPVAWVSDRKTTLAAMFALASLIAYVRYVQRGRAGLLVVCAGCFTMSLLSKPTTTLLPVALVLLDCWPLRRLNVRSLLEKVPLFAIAAISAVVTYLSQANTASAILPRQGDDVPLILALCYKLGLYLEKMVWPVNLTSLYPHPDPLALSNPQIYLRAIVLVVAATLLALSLRRTRAMVIGCLVFLVLLAPTLGGISFTNMIAADRYVYFPAIGLVIALGWLVRQGWEHLERARGMAFARNTLLAVAIGVAALEFIGVRAYLVRWRDTNTFEEYMLGLAPKSALIHYNRGISLGAANKLDEAVAEFRTALKLDPNNASAHNNLGNTLMKLQSDEAEVHLRRAVELFPQGAAACRQSLATARVNLANVLAMKLRYDEAFAQYEQALPITSEPTELYRNYGIALQMAGRNPQAIEHLTRAIEMGAGDPRAHNRLGLALAALGRAGPAAEHFREALRLAPDWPDPAEHLARLATGIATTTSPP